MSNKKKIIIAVVALVVIMLVIYFVRRRKKMKEEEISNIALPPIAHNPAQTVTANIEANDKFPLQKGSKGANVTYLQNALNKINPTGKIAVDGSFGDATRNKILTTINTTAYPVTAEIFANILSQANAIK